MRLPICLLILLVSTPLKAEDKYPWTKKHGERLQIAIAQDDFPLAEAEIKAGAEPSDSSSTNNVFSPFTDAIACKKLRWVQWLLGHGANVNTPDSYQTPLMTAAMVGDNEIFEFLLQRGADYKARNAAKENAFIVAARNYRADTLEYIAEHHPEIVREGTSLNEALLAAAGAGASQSTRVLLQLGADVKARGDWEETPLIAASMWGYVIVAQILLEHGADVNAKDNWDNTALHMAANGGYPKLIKTLLAAGADSTIKDRSLNETPAITARRQGHQEAARLLRGVKKALPAPPVGAAARAGRPARAADAPPGRR